MTKKGHWDYFHKILRDPSRKTYAILANRQHVGNCGFKNLTPSRGELWIYIGEGRLRGKGIGKTASQLLIRRGFQHLKLKTIYLHVADYNLPAFNLYKKLGFRKVPFKPDPEWQNRKCTVVRMQLKGKRPA